MPETHGIFTEEFVGLRPKMYSPLYSENNKMVEKKVASGKKVGGRRKVAKHITRGRNNTINNPYFAKNNI